MITNSAKKTPLSKPTAAQAEAANPQLSAWVAANAGSGKTKVLSDRVLRLLLEGVAPQRIYCLTYTKAAAAEMSVRVQNALRSWVTLPETELQEVLENLTGKPATSTLMQRARHLFIRVVDSDEGIHINTIHALCQSLLRRFALEAGVSPHFRLMDEQETQVLLKEAQLRFYTAPTDIEASASLNQAILQTMGIVSEYSLNELLTQIIAERDKLEAVLSKTKQDHLQALQQQLDVREELYTLSAESLAAYYFQYDAAEEAILEEAVEILTKSKAVSDNKRAKALQQWLTSQRTLQDTEIWVKSLLSGKSEKIKPCTKSMMEKYPALATLLEREMDRAYDYRQLFLARESIALSQTAWFMARKILEIYRNLKLQRGLLDFEDLISHTDRLLQQANISSWVLYKLDGGIEHLLVDEAQDTSPIQWRLIAALTTEFFSGESVSRAHRTLFVVGDEKQSIYRFQGADPQAFAEMKNYFAARIRSAERPFSPVSLTLSYRSAPEILQAVDAVFAEAEYREGVVFSESHITHAPEKSFAGRVELWPLVEGAADEEENETEDNKTQSEEENSAVPALHDAVASELLAAKIAKTISGWLKEKRPLNGKQRPVQAGDIMILVQGRSPLFHAIIRALKQENLPIAGADRLLLHSHITVQDMLALCRFLLLPEDDLSLCGVLKSPLFGFSEEAIFELCYGRQKSSVWQQLRQQKAEPFLSATQKLEEWLNLTDYLPPYELLAQILENTHKIPLPPAGGVRGGSQASEHPHPNFIHPHPSPPPQAGEGAYRIISGREAFTHHLGAEANDPLSELLSLAQQYEHLHQPSLQGFVQWFDQSAIEIKRDMEASGNAIRVLTIHGAKGLEAPIVFLPDTTSKPRNKQRIYLTNDPECLLWNYSSSWLPSAAKKWVEAEKNRQLQEYRRLLYVAMTRAEEELYLCGTKTKKNLSEGCWYQMFEQTLKPLLREEIAENIPLPQAREEEDTPALSLPTPPLWLHQPAPEEPLPPKPLTPSRPSAPDPEGDAPVFAAAAMQRGKLIHLLLETLPDVSPDLWEDSAHILLQKYWPQGGTTEKHTLMREVLAILQHPDFSEVFKPGSQAEVAITGIVADENGQPRILSGQIDRLRILPNKILLVDYKTNYNPPNSAAQIPPSYLQQMQAYTKALRAIYPHHSIEAAILWTHTPSLMAV